MSSVQIRYPAPTLGDKMTQKEILERAYGNIPKEPIIVFQLDWIPTIRGVKYYWLRLRRLITR